jgi:hypothetical protein
VEQERSAAHPLRLQHLQQKQTLDLDSQARQVDLDNLARWEQRVRQRRQQRSDLEERQAHKVPLVHRKLPKQTINLPRQSLHSVPLEQRHSQRNPRIRNQSLEFHQLRSRRRRVRPNPQIPRVLLVRLEGHRRLLRRNLNLHGDFRRHQLNLAKQLPFLASEGPIRRHPQQGQLSPPSLQGTHQP